MKIKIGEKFIAKDNFCFIIAEAGVNHNGNIDRAKELVKTAKEIGADAVKFQTFWDLGCLKEYELTKKQWVDLKLYCDEIGIEFMSTPHWGSPYCGYKDEDYEVIDFVDTLVKRHKIASPYLTNRRYVIAIANKRKPIILSTGSIIHKNRMATIAEINQALTWLYKMDITLLHCISKYPLKSDNYSRVQKLRRFGVPVGVSDHTQNINIPSFPVIEKHFKLDDNCIDANVSLNPEQFKQMVDHVRNKEK